MFIKLRKFIGIFLVLTLIFTRVFVLWPVFAQEGVPTVPPPPSAPTSNSALPPPSVPSVPTALTQTTTVAPVPTVPPLPTSGSETTAATLPTSPPEPTSATSNTVDSLSGQSDLTPSPTGSSSDQNGYNNSSTDSNSSSGSVNDPANINTGPGSQNEAYENLNKKLEVMNQNLAELQNKIDAISTSGFNYANFNTLDGQVFTGDTQAAINLMNKLNSNMTGVGTFEVFNVYGTYLNDIIFQMTDGSATGSFSEASPTVSKNVTTGPGSTNIADASNTFTVKEANGNEAKIQNDINLQAASGSNSASYNTGNGVVSTGDAKASGNIVNMANTNLNVSQWLWGVVNIFGTLAGNIILPQDSGNSSNTTASPATLVENSNTGPMSNNTANYEKIDTATFENANTADIATSINATANSGNNTSDANTGGGLVLTGNTDVAVSDTTIANSNTVKEEATVWMVVVNEAGKWVGHILGLDWGTNYASNALPMSGTTVQNSGTGPLSDNTASFTETSNTTVTNNNTASIDNNINITADTGNNTASYNTGAGVIQTGDAKAGLNIVNMANTNVTAKKFIAVLVNVLGAWLGNVVTPDEQIPAANNEEVLPTLPPLPTIPPVGSIDDSYYPPSGETNTSEENFVAFTYYESQSSVNYAYPESYNQAVNQVNNARYFMRQQQNRSLLAISAQQAQVEEQGRVLKRGLFMSPAFAKATEGSFPGILLGGISFKVTQSWLSVIPLALFVIILRRRKKYNLEKYFNAILQIIL